MDQDELQEESRVKSEVISRTDGSEEGIKTVAGDVVSRLAVLQKQKEDLAARLGLPVDVSAEQIRGLSKAAKTRNAALKRRAARGPVSGEGDQPRVLSSTGVAHPERRCRFIVESLERFSNQASGDTLSDQFKDDYRDRLLLVGRRLVERFGN